MRLFRPRFLVLLFPFLVWGHFAEAQELPNRADTLRTMQKVCDWQLARLPSTRPANSNTGWIRTVFFVGDLALYRSSRQMKYFSAMVTIGAQNQWRMGIPKAGANNPADYQAIGQLYTELYLIRRDPEYLADTQRRMDVAITSPRRGRDNWWWCDSLFMAPPLLTRLSAATGDLKYVTFMDRQWWDSVAFLYNAHEHLMFRDKSFFSKTTPNGSPVFWSRGNGWVLAGTARILQFLPQDFPSRQKYVGFFDEMSNRIAGLQQPDGFWRPSLLDPDSFPDRETSGTGLFCYAMAWGINAGILPRNRYLPIVTNAWKALVSTVDPDTGKLGWVQPPGDRPAAVHSTDTSEYGVGAFLLAGSEMLKLEPPP